MEAPFLLQSLDQDPLLTLPPKDVVNPTSSHLHCSHAGPNSVTFHLQTLNRLSFPVLGPWSTLGGPDEKLIRLCASLLNSGPTIYCVLCSLVSIRLAWLCCSSSTEHGSLTCRSPDTCPPALFPASSLCSNVISALGESLPTLHKSVTALPSPKHPLIFPFLYIRKKCFFVYF